MWTKFSGSRGHAPWSGTAGWSWGPGLEGGAFNQPRDHQAEVPPAAFRFSTFLLALILPAFSVQPSQRGCRGISCRNHAWPGFCGP